jgi:hypothetical protein
MALYLPDYEEDEDKQWRINCAPQQLTDIIIQVSMPGHADCDFADLSFSLGELLRSEIDGYAGFEGHVVMTDEEMATTLRWAELLEAYALILRAALKAPRLIRENTSGKQ